MLRVYNSVIIFDNSRILLVLFHETNAEQAMRPTTKILHRHPELIHRVKRDFGTDIGVSNGLFTNKELHWRKFDVIHLLFNHRSYSESYHEL